MPKQKSHSGSKKRFDITGTGRVKRAQSGKKDRKRKRSLRQTAFVSETQEATVKGMIPYKQ